MGDIESLSLASPARNNVQALVDYMKNPTTYDGLESIAEIHPSIKSADIFPKMRSLTEDDLEAISKLIALPPAAIVRPWHAWMSLRCALTRWLRHRTRIEAQRRLCRAGAAMLLTAPPC